MVESYAGAVPGEVEMLWTQGPGHATGLARQAAARGGVVCAIGGDGTVSEVVNGLMPDPVPLVVVPTGSGNDFASLVDCPASPAELVRVLEEGAGIRMDVIDCGDRWCGNSIGIGFEAMVTYHSLTIRNMRGLPLYLAAVFKALRSLDRIRYTLEVDGRVVSDGEYLLISIGNGPRAGGGFYINPRATPIDGKMDVCAAQRMSRLRLLSVLPLAIGGKHLDKRGIEFHRGETITVSSNHPFPIHIDGEYLGRRDRPLQLKIVPKRLPVLCLRGGRILREQPLERLL